jgi:hypothetical protein
MLFIWEVTAGELLVGIGTLALAAVTYLLVREERTARKEHIKPRFGLTGTAYVLNLDVPHSLLLKCLSGIAKEVKVEYKYENEDVIKKYALSLAGGDTILLDEKFMDKYKKGGIIQIKIAFKYNSSYDTEELTVNIEEIKKGQFKIPMVAEV